MPLPVTPAELYRAVDALDAFAGELKNLYFVEMDGSYCDQYDYCLDCAKAKRDELGPESVLCGGCTSEEDGPRYCQTCGAKLEYVATDYCSNEMIGFFSDFRRLRKLRREDAYDIARALAAVVAADDAPTRRALRLARRAVQLLPANAEASR